MNEKPDFKLLFCLFTVAVVWGTTYLGIRVAVETMQPWYITSTRQGLAALIILVILLYKKQLAWIGWENFKLQFIPAILMIVLANGFTTIAEQSVPSGLTSILSALSPLVVFLGGTMIGQQKPSIKGFLGVMVGFLGVVFIFRDGLGDILDPNYKTGIFYLSIAILSWSVGTVYTKMHTHKSNNIALNLFYQFSIAAIIQFVLALILNPDVDFNAWSSRSIFATLYLSVFGSVIAFFAYHYALKRVTATQVSVLNYINTIIAVFLGWLLLDEVITFDFVIATVLIILGVFITNYKRTRGKSKQPDTSDSELAKQSK
ncbi:EamA family transporter [Flavobacterium sp. J49]|uniref:DMT family transporter n=1 Tax=Flavobacterium sp. J49 TaxID=2718534 RepID=UPI0015936ED1|nr:EamA family transporter [Flavobacterium sp. J49]MBF6640637.1 EamA family transporter [Flavobacterium sp. J49]NIC01884.1 EamA family transporter [Flavobacterium sp. J49]